MRRLYLVVLALFLTFLAGNKVFAEEQDNQSFLILTVLFKNNEFTIVNQRRIRAPLKAARPHLRRGELLTFNFEDTNGVAVANIEIPHPAFQHAEVEDSNHTGSLNSVELTHPEMEFLVRIPFVKGIKHLSIFQYSPVTDSQLKAAATKQLVGHLDLDGDAIQ
ncbi:MAG: hypothetical protein JWM04_2718 [Verrucomicrobiales bacterium]|nr:hypothetical protein [Verrucomicrobiales bacterium]